MSGIMSMLLGAVSSAITDAYFNLVTLLLPGNGTNGAQNNTFLDSSTNNFTITRNGNTTQGTFSPFSQTGWSNFFDGTSDSLLTPGDTNLVLDGNFTIEFFMYLNSLSISAPISSNHGSFTSGAFAAIISHGTASNKLSIWAENINNASFIIASNSTLSISQWYHVALVRNSGVIRLYLNGVDEGNTSSSATITLNGGTTPRFRIGQYWGGTINGYISNLRVVKGTALYTGAFTPSTSPLTTTSQGATATEVELLTCQSNRFVDNSTNAFVMTPSGDTSVQAFSPFAPAAAYSVAAVGGSGYFDGTGDFLTLGTSTNLALGAGDFTIDVWLYLTAYNGSLGVIFDWRTAGSTPTNIPLFSLSPSGVPAFWQSVSLGAAITGSSAVPLNTWAHLAVVRNGLGSNNLTMYLNGTSIGSATATNSLGIETLRLNDSQGSFGQAGYFSSARIVKGRAVYTSNFAPPVAPLTPIANTMLLLTGTNSGLIDYAGKNILETVGNAQLSTAVKKFGSASMYFDGTGDYITFVNSDLTKFNTGDFTMECWTYLTARINGYPAIFSNYNSFTTGSLSLFAGHASANTTKYQVASSGTFPAIQSTTSVAYNVWVHLAVVRYNNVLTLYINGTADGTVNVTSTNFTGVGSLWYVGTTGDDISGGCIQGYIDDFRITKGIARYTSNFTAPTQAFITF